jgi:gliding motility-associated-like protein
VQFGKLIILSCLFILVSTFTVTGQYNFSANDTEDCTPMRIKFTYVSTASVDSVASFYWDFGNGQTSTLEIPDSVTYETAGLYDITLVLLFNNGGEEWITKPDYIDVHHTVPANFIYYDTVSYTTYVFKHNEPLDVGPVYTFDWNIESFGPRTGSWQLVTFPDTGTYTVTLTVSDDLGCTSKTSQEVAVYEEISIQNVFTPNNDGENDWFVLTSGGGLPLVLRIFTRAGSLVYEIEGTTLTWDGRTASGLELSPGIYFYAVEALQGDPNKRYTKAGVLYLYK